MATTARVIPFQRKPRPTQGANYSDIRNWAAQCARAQLAVDTGVAELLTELVQRIEELERKISA